MFKDITDKSGINYTGTSHGLAWGDYNNDGFIDLWVSNHHDPATLYQNDSNGKFTDVTSTAFDEELTEDFHGSAWADFDNDGDLDLIQLLGGSVGQSSLSKPKIANRLYVNDQGTFTDQGIESGLGHIGSRGRSPLWFDYNNDGLLDLFQGALKRNDGKVPATIFRQDATTSSFIDLGTELDFDLTSTRAAVLSDLTDNGNPELILLNRSKGISIYDSTTITDITDSVLTAEYQAEDIVSADFNGDLLPDLYLTNKRSSNSGFTTPESKTLNLQLVAKAESKGISFKTAGTINLDLFTFGYGLDKIEMEDIYIGASGLTPEDLDLVTDTGNKTIAQLTLSLDPEDKQVQGLAPITDGENEGLYIGFNPTLKQWELHLSTPEKDLVGAHIESEHEITETKAIGFDNDLEPELDRLLLNGDSGLVDYTDASGLNSVTTAGVSTVAGDFDNDMDLDLYILTTNVAGNEPNILYDNQGDGTFVAREDLGPAEGSNLGIGDSVSTSDYNNDGFLDLFITNGGASSLLLDQDAPYQLLENEGNDNHWLEIDLEGVFSNRDGIGAKVYVTAGGVTQLRQQGGGMHQKVQNDSRLHFGLADNTMVEEIRIEWSSGIVQTIQDVGADQILDIVEPDQLLF